MRISCRSNSIMLFADMYSTRICMFGDILESVLRTCASIFLDNLRGYCRYYENFLLSFLRVICTYIEMLPATISICILHLNVRIF